MTSGPRIQCLECGDIIRSDHRHEMVWCSCKAVAIDGGGAYTRILGSKYTWVKEGDDV